MDFHPKFAWSRTFLRNLGVYTKTMNWLGFVELSVSQTNILKKVHSPCGFLWKVQPEGSGRRSVHDW